MNTWLSRCLLGGLLLASPALAQEEDSPYRYSDDETDSYEEEQPRRRSRYADPGDEFREIAEQEGDEPTFKKMYRLDDPNTGIAGEFLAGALLLDNPAGAAKVGLGLGLRFTWEFGRLLDNSTLHEALWGDVRWTYGNLQDGTTLVHGKSNIHFFTVAPAYELKLARYFGVFAQVGIGAAFQATSLTVGEQETVVNGMKPVLQYGVGLRARPRLSDALSLSIRLEAMRFRRGYMDDTFLGGSIGTAF